MNINNALAAYSSEYTSTQNKMAATEVEGGKSLPPPPQEKSTVTDELNKISTVGRAFATHGTSIMQQYNLRDITPRQMVDMSQQLHDNGLISLKEHAQLSFQPEINLENYQQVMGSEAKPDLPRDYISEWEERLSVQRSTGTPPAITKETERMVKLLDTLQSMHTDANLPPVNDDSVGE